VVTFTTGTLDPYKVIVTPAAAPKLVSAKLADSLGSIDVLFDRATDQVGLCNGLMLVHFLA
jgi:alanine dehydrogenase